MSALKPKLVPLGKSQIEVPVATAKEASKIAKRSGRCFIIRRGDDWKVKNCMASIAPDWEIVGKMTRDGVVFAGMTLVISECDRLMGIFKTELAELTKLHDLLESDSVKQYHIKTSQHYLLQSHDLLEFARDKLLKQRSHEISKEAIDNTGETAKEIENV